MKKGMKQGFIGFLGKFLVVLFTVGLLCGMQTPLQVEGSASPEEKKDYEIQWAMGYEGV